MARPVRLVVIMPADQVPVEAEAGVATALPVLVAKAAMLQRKLVVAAVVRREASVRRRVIRPLGLAVPAVAGVVVISDSVAMPGQVLPVALLVPAVAGVVVRTAFRVTAAQVGQVLSATQRSNG